MDRGWTMLERNIERISLLARSLLGFSKGEPPKVSLVDPVKLAKEVVNLYKEATQKSHVKLNVEAPKAVRRAPMDREGMHSCLANLVSNAIDACQMSEKSECKVILRCKEEGDTLIYEVADQGCGMDYEIKKKAFTTFFTTKGKGGTGLGLLLTRKIVQEHGGKISYESTPGKGTVFRLRFQRQRLPKPNKTES
jgi:signal transduction histidine kinase